MKDKSVFYPAFLRFFITAAAAAGIFSCSLNYEKGMLDEEISDKTPNAVLINFREVAVRRGNPAYIVEAERAETFNKKNLTVFSSLYFAEYSRENEIATEGEAVRAEFYSDTENISFDEYFILNSRQQGYSIEGDSVFWDGKSKTLTGGKNKEIKISKSNGTIIIGKDFFSSPSNKSFSFESGLKGIYISDDEKE